MAKSITFGTTLRVEPSNCLPALGLILLFHLSLIELRPWRCVRLSTSTLTPVVIYTDASCEAAEDGHVVDLCFVLIDRLSQVGGRARLTQAVLASMDKKQTYISHGEAFAPLFCLYHVGRQIFGRSIIWFIDNMGILAAYTKGSSCTGDISCIVHAMLLSSAKLRLKSWFEHVDSHANPADGGTRGKDKALNMILPVLPLPPWPTNTSEAPPAVWLSWLNFHFKV